MDMASFKSTSTLLVLSASRYRSCYLPHARFCFKELPLYHEARNWPRLAMWNS
jgi:hypothetical protein